MKRCELVVLIAAAALLIVNQPGHATTIRVPLDQPTIQEGMDVATEGDTVLVAPGTYAGLGNRDLDFPGVNFVLVSEAGAAATIIDCEGLSGGLSVYSGVDSTCVISGFTVENGNRMTGGGISVGDSSPIVEDCIVRNCTGSNGGGIRYGYSLAQGIIRNCVVYGNTVRFRGGGILATHGYSPDYVPVIIRDCVVYDNEESTDSAYGGGGIFCAYSDATIVGCTVVGNTGEPGAGAIYGNSCYPVVRRTVSAFNLSGPGVYNVDADHCIVYGNVGDGDAPQLGGDRENLDTDPLFCDLGIWDLTVCDDSPCIAGDPENPWGEQVGALGSGCGSCDTVLENTTWGSIKAMYLSP